MLMKGSFTSFALAALLLAVGLLVFGLVQWGFPLNTADLRIQPIFFSVLLLVTAGGYCLIYPMLRRFLRPLQHLYNALDAERSFKMAILLCVFVGYEAGAQSCNCEYYMYLNDPQVQAGVPGGGFVHKFRINSDGTFTEIFSNPPTNTIPWFPPFGGLPVPHGLAQDLNGNIYIGESDNGGGNNDIRKLSCSGAIVSEATFKIDDGGYNFSSRDGIVYVNSSFKSNHINAYRICDGSLIGWVTLNDPTNVDGSPQSDFSGTVSEDWGFYIAPNGTFYASTGDRKSVV